MDTETVLARNPDRKVVPMSAYLEAVAQAAEHRTTAEAAFYAAIVRAADHHSLRQIAPHAGMTFSGVQAVLIRERSNDDVSAR